MLVELEMIGQRSGQLLVDPDKPAEAEGFPVFWGFRIFGV